MPTSRRSERRPYHAPHVPLAEIRTRGGVRVERRYDGEWAVRAVTTPGVYRCPECLQQITPGSNHVVAWRRDGWAGEQAGLDERRHWHTSCWNRRGRLR